MVGQLRLDDVTTIPYTGIMCLERHSHCFVVSKRSDVRAVCCFLILLVVALPRAQADGEWTLNGYGTLAGVYSSDRRADYRPDPAASEGAGRSGAWNGLSDSRVAVQVTGRPSADSRFSATAQVVVENQFDRSFAGDLEWGYLQYDVTPRLLLRVGRTALGTFMISDHRKVGYTLPWARPPAELHQLVAITNSDGIDALYRRRMGPYEYTAQLSWGRNEMSELDGVIEAPHLFSFRNRLQRGNLTVHASVLDAELVLDGLRPLWEGYRALGPAGERVVTRYDASGEHGLFLGLGVEYDPGDWFVMAEWGQGDSDSGFGERYGWYLSGGWRLGSVTPYLTLSRGGGGRKPGDVDGVDPGALSGEAAGLATELNRYLRLIQSGTTPHQRTVSAGLRWRAMPGIGFKLQYDDVEPRAGSIGSFRNTAPGYTPRGADIVTLSMDFLF